MAGNRQTARQPGTNKVSTHFILFFTPERKSLDQAGTDAKVTLFVVQHAGVRGNPVTFFLVTHFQGISC